MENDFQQDVFLYKTCKHRVKHNKSETRGAKVSRGDLRTCFMDMKT